MTVAQKILGYLQTYHTPICDDCLAKELKLPRRQQAAAVTATLGEMPAFSRYSGSCGFCSDAPKLVIAGA